MTRKTVDQLLCEARARIAPRREPIEAHEALARGALLLDVRLSEERGRSGIIPGALHVPRSHLEWRADPASEGASPHLGDLEREVIAFCTEGYSSSLAALTLRELGYARATDLVGGFVAWKEAGLPTSGAPPDPAGATLPGLGGLDP